MSADVEVCGAVWPWYRGTVQTCSLPAGHAEQEGLTRWDLDTWHQVQQPSGATSAWTDRAHAGLTASSHPGKSFAPMTREEWRAAYGHSPSEEELEHRRRVRAANRIIGGRDGRSHVALLDGEVVATPDDWR